MLSLAAGSSSSSSSSFSSFSLPRGRAPRSGSSNGALALRAPQVPPRDARAGLRPPRDAQKGLGRAEEAGSGAQEGQGQGPGRDRGDDRRRRRFLDAEVGETNRQRLSEPPRLRPPRRHGRPPDPRGVRLPFALEEQGDNARLRARRAHDDAPRCREAPQGEGGQAPALAPGEQHRRAAASQPPARLGPPPVPARRGGRGRGQGHGRRGRARGGQRGAVGPARLARAPLGPRELAARHADGRGRPVGGRGEGPRGSRRDAAPGEGPRGCGVGGGYGTSDAGGEGGQTDGWR